MARDKGGAYILLIPAARALARPLHPSFQLLISDGNPDLARKQLLHNLLSLTAIPPLSLSSSTQSLTLLSLHLYYRAQTSEFAKKLRPEEDHLAAAGFLRRKGKGEMTTFCIFKPGSCPFLRRLRRHLSRRVNKLSMTASLHLRLFILIAAFLRFY